ncbi:sensor histidine kinase [Paenibacillus glycinis]|uniref:histidine kinase n=1 Tax=Paenibacillus glycinis TaxID=2697035 RepID=A0ABW9XN41_9BACL|nr:sensor histidine kinase [Paenibacillus glycinis]NBD24035.1 sensor histidine kinase [Paenibacillus glycinis]
MRKWLNGRPNYQGPPLVFTLVWLVYLVFPLVSLFQLPAVEIVEGLGAVLVFVALYICGYLYERPRLVAVLGLLLIALLFCLKFDATGVYLAFYPSPIIGQLKKRRDLVVGYAAMLSFFTYVIAHFQVYNDQDMLVQLLPAMLVMLIMPVGFKLGQRSKELRMKLNLANEEIARLSKNEERQRISRDLHDTLGHTLSLITLKSELAEKLIGKNPERAAQEVKDIQMTSRAALKQVRELVSGMNAVTIGQEVDHAKQILAAAGIVLEQRGDLATGVPADSGDDGRSDPETRSSSPLIENILGMCLRESVTNVVKHSRASVCTVELRREPGRLRLTVEDDGVGLPSKDEAAAGCNGMKGMRDRLKLIEGVLTAERLDAKHGTRLVFAVPLVDKAGEGG